MTANIDDDLEIVSWRADGRHVASRHSLKDENGGDGGPSELQVDESGEQEERAADEDEEAEDEEEEQSTTEENGLANGTTSPQGRKRGRPVRERRRTSAIAITLATCRNKKKPTPTTTRMEAKRSASSRAKL